MKRALTTATACTFVAATANAGGLDRTGQPLGILFEEGNYAELSFAKTTPDISGTGYGIAVGGFTVLPEGTAYDDVGDSFTSLGAGLKFQINEQVSAALIYDQPFGSDIIYSGDPATTELGGTRAIADSSSVTALLRYKVDDNWSVHGGLRIQQVEGQIDLRGLAYGGFNGYSVELESDTSVGYVVGAAYEVPEIALRVALTYNSAITHKMGTKETLDTGAGVLTLAEGGKTEVKTPQSVTLDLQTGIAEDTLLFGSIRWAQWSEFKIDPAVFTPAAGGGLVDLDDWTTYTIGVGRQFTEDFAASIAISYEDAQDELVSPLAPTNGLTSVSLGASYDVSSNVTLSGGVRYSWLGDAKPETGTPDVARANFTDNDALSVGFKIGYRF